MLMRRSQILIFLMLAISLLFSAINYFAQTPVEKMQKVLSAKASFTEDELTKLKQGEMIAKLLPVQDKREVAVCGIISLKTPLDLGLKTFQEVMSRQNRQSIVQIGDFSQTPNLQDIQTLTLEKGDIEDLKKCQVGKCGVRLSAAMIERFQKEMDWTATDYATQANRLFRQIMLEYVQDSLLRGDEALIEYNNQSDALRLQSEHISLLNNLLWINDFAPEFSKYLRDFPRSELSNVSKTVSWAKLKFGLKPVIIITQTINYTTEKDGLSQILSISKQIYATRYFDSSLGLTALIKFSDSNDSYLLYTNHSRSSSLEGMFSNFKHEIVEREAIDKLKPLLQDTKLFAEANLNKPIETTDSADNQSFVDWFFGKNYWIWAVFLIIVLFGLFWFRKKLLKSKT